MNEITVSLKQTLVQSPVTKEEAMTESAFHFGFCKETIGPRGGRTLHQVRVRANGRCQTWKTRPDEFRLPIKCGLYEYGEITHRNAHEFHAAKNCPF